MLISDYLRHIILTLPHLKKLIIQHTSRLTVYRVQTWKEILTTNEGLRSSSCVLMSVLTGVTGESQAYWIFADQRGASWRFWLFLRLYSLDFDRLSNKIEWWPIMINSLPIFFPRRSIDKDTSLFLHRTIKRKILRKRLIQLFSLINLMPNKLIKLPKDLLNSLVRSCLIMSTLIDRNPLKLWWYMFHDILSMMWQDNLILFTTHY